MANHISNKTGCPSCAGTLAWTRERFIQRATVIHGNRFDYSLIPEKIRSETEVIIICMICRQKIYTTVCNHIHTGGCKTCSGRDLWTYEKFTRRAHEVHGDKYSYALSPTDELHAYIMIQVTCKICSHAWTCSLNNHLNNRSGCPSCAGLLPWTLDRFIQRSRELHGDRFCYDAITPGHIQGAYSRVPLICNTCKQQWNACIHDHISRKSGCPVCAESKGELECAKQLELLNIPFKRQASIESLPRKRFDFGFEVSGIRYLLEFDGTQHFEFAPHYHSDMEQFEEKQALDVLKVQSALNEGYHIIRIDSKSIMDIRAHIENALRSNQPLYFSNEAMYGYIIDNLK